MIALAQKTASPALSALLSAPQLDVEALAAHLDGLGTHERVAAVRSINGSHQGKLWDACEGRATTLEDIVPANLAPAVEVIHAGKNSLPMFSHFEKRFCRVAGQDDRLYGYNEGSTRHLIGPGYFVAVEDPSRNEVGVNYYEVPPNSADLPANWPAIKKNEAGLQRFVFSKMIDYLRKVSSTVTIGRAYRQGKASNQYFLLCKTGYEGG